MLSRMRMHLYVNPPNVNARILVQECMDLVHHVVMYEDLACIIRSADGSKRFALCTSDGR
jgi:hypothetical protein